MSVRTGLGMIEERVAKACLSAGRQRQEVTMIAVSKGRPLESILEAYACGQRHFGESRLQEALPKIQAAPKDIVWHFIGALQSNKARRVFENFAVIHSLESESQVMALRHCAIQRDTFVEVNLTGEEQKSGVAKEKLGNFREMLVELPVAKFQGLMALGSARGSLEDTRSLFREARSLNERLGGQWLSLGMSGDFEVAIQEGSTHVRIGTAIFGSGQGV